MTSVTRQLALVGCALVAAGMGCKTPNASQTLAGETPSSAPLELTGYKIAPYLGVSSSADSEASLAHECADFKEFIYRTFDPKYLASVECGVKENLRDANVDPPGFLWVQKPVVRLKATGALKRWTGVTLKTEVYPSHGPHNAIRDWHNRCENELRMLRALHGESMKAGDCGQPRNIAPQSGQSGPQFQLESTIQYWLDAQEGAEAVRFRAGAVVTTEAEVDGFPGWIEKLSTYRDRLVLAGDTKGALTQIDLQTKERVWSKALRDEDPNFNGDEFGIPIVDVSRDGKQLLIGGRYGYLQILSNTDGSLVRWLDQPQNGSGHHVVSVFSPDNRFVATAVMSPNAGHIGNVDFVSNSERFAEARKPLLKRYPITLLVLNAESGEVKAYTYLTTANFRQLGFSEQGDRLWAVTNDEVYIFDVDHNFAVIKKLSLATIEPGIRDPVIHHAQLSDDWRFISLSVTSGVIVVNMENLEVIQRFETGQEVSPRVTGFSQDRRTLYGADAWGGVYAWDLTSGQLIYTTQKLFGTVSNLYSATFATDDKTLLIATPEGFTRYLLPPATVP